MDFTFDVIQESKMDRCVLCNKKTFCIFACTCKGRFCSKCRMPEDHKCTFNFKEQYQEFLKIRNPKMISDKVEKI